MREEGDQGLWIISRSEASLVVKVEDINALEEEEEEKEEEALEFKVLQPKVLEVKSLEDEGLRDRKPEAEDLEWEKDVIWDCCGGEM